MKKTYSFLYLIILLSLFSCSPLYVLFVENKTEKPIDIFVELKNLEHNKKYRKIFEKREMYFYEKKKNYQEFPIDSIKNYYKMSETIPKKYRFTSDLQYNFTINPNLLTNIDPNNGISIYPFENVYFFENGKKCFIVPLNKNDSCSIKLIHKEKLKKNGTTHTIMDYAIIENN